MTARPGRCPLCRYAFPDDLADVAVPRHAPTHSVDQWAQVVSAALRGITDEENRHTEQVAGLRSQLAGAMAWAAAAQTEDAP